MSFSLNFKHNPFYILHAVPEDSPEQLKNRYQIALRKPKGVAAALTVDEAYQALTQSEPRLKAVLTWASELARAEVKMRPARWWVTLPEELPLLNKANMWVNRYLSYSKINQDQFKTLLEGWLKAWREHLDDLDRDQPHGKEWLKQFEGYSKKQIEEALKALYSEHLKLLLPNAERVQWGTSILSVYRRDQGALQKEFTAHINEYRSTMTKMASEAQGKFRHAEFDMRGKAVLLKIDQFLNADSEKEREECLKEVEQLFTDLVKTYQTAKHVQNMAPQASSFVEQVLKVLQFESISPYYERANDTHLKTFEEFLRYIYAEDVERSYRDLILSVLIRIGSYFPEFSGQGYTELMRAETWFRYSDVKESPFFKYYLIMKANPNHVFEMVPSNRRDEKCEELGFSYKELMESLENILCGNEYLTDSAYTIMWHWFKEPEIVTYFLGIEAQVVLLDLKALLNRYPFPSWGGRSEEKYKAKLEAALLTITQKQEKREAERKRRVQAQYLLEIEALKRSLEEDEIFDGTLKEQLSNEEDIKTLIETLPQSFKANPFYTLGATPEDDLEQLAKRYKLALATADYEDSFKVGQAYEDLSLTLPRFGAKLTWALDLSFDEVIELVTNLEKDIPNSLSLLSQVNILTNRMLEHPTMGAEDYANQFRHWMQAWQVVLDAGCWVGGYLEVFKQLYQQQFKTMLPNFERFLALQQQLIRGADPELFGINLGGNKRLAEVESRGVELMSHYLTQFRESMLANIEGLWSIVNLEAKEAKFNEIHERLNEWVRTYPVIEAIKERWSASALELNGVRLDPKIFVDDLFKTITLDWVKNSPKSLEFFSHQMKEGNAALITNYKMGELLADFFAEHIGLTDTDKKAAREEVKLYQVELNFELSNGADSLFFGLHKEVMANPILFITGINEQAVMTDTKDTVNLYKLLNALEVALKSAKSTRQRMHYFNLTKEWFSGVSSFSNDNKFKALIAIIELENLINQYAKHSDIILGEAAKAYKEALYKASYHIYIGVVDTGGRNIPPLVLERIYKAPELNTSLKNALRVRQTDKHLLNENKVETYITQILMIVAVGANIAFFSYLLYLFFFWILGLFM